VRTCPEVGRCLRECVLLLLTIAERHLKVRQRQRHLGTFSLLELDEVRDKLKLEPMKVAKHNLGSTFT